LRRIPIRTNIPRNLFVAERAAVMENSGITRETANLIRKRYQRIPESGTEEILERVMRFIFDTHDETTLQSLLNNAAKSIHRIFDFNEVTIGLRGGDGLFRYEAFVGLTKDAEKKLREIAYDKKQMTESKEYPGVAVTKYSEFCLSESKPYKVGEEELSYNRPLVLGSGRKAPTEMIEGDYIDIYIYGSKDDMLGWIELGNPQNGTFPPREHIKWLELFSALLGVAIKHEKLSASRRKKL